MNAAGLCTSSPNIGVLYHAGTDYKPSRLEPDAPPTYDPSIYSLHALLHPFMAAMGLVVLAVSKP